MQHSAPSMLACSGWNVSVEWTEEELRTMEACLMRYPADRFDALQRYVRAAAALPRKTVRDVALRSRWTLLQQQLKKRTAIEPARKMGVPPMASKPSVMPMQGAPPFPAPPFVLPPGAAGMADGAATVEGPIASLLETNLAILNQFRANMAVFKVHENTQLLVQFRDNVVQVMSAMEAMGGVMAQMPPLPVKLNVDLANSFLPARSPGVMAYDGTMLPPPPQPQGPGMVPLHAFASGAGSGLAPRVHPKRPLPPPPLPVSPPQPAAAAATARMPARPPSALPGEQQPAAAAAAAAGGSAAAPQAGSQPAAGPATSAEHPAATDRQPLPALKEEAGE